MGFFPLQTSLISPNFPARQPPEWLEKISCAFGEAVAAQGSFWADLEVLGGKGCGFAPFLWEKITVVSKNPQGNLRIFWEGIAKRILPTKDRYANIQNRMFALFPKCVESS